MPSLPKGGGAIRGIGEKFAANPVTGSGTTTVPIPTSPGRDGFGPDLALTYDSGAGNGPFGFGWSLSLPRITRKTDKGLPRYRDADESDVFVLSGAEDLVPVLLPDGSRHADTAPGFTIHRYRPRAEGLFARIERWIHAATGDVHWRTITRDNVTTIYGRDGASRIEAPRRDPERGPRRIFEWLICESHDDKGNAIVYEYAVEDDLGVDRMRPNERNRSRSAARYLKRIRYGNRVSRLVEPDLATTTWLFEVVFDYHEDHCAPLPLDASRPAAAQHRFVEASIDCSPSWRVRPDPFSSYRPGFEVRSYRRCARILMFHRFAELGAEPCLVRSTELQYDDLVEYSRVAPSPPVDDELLHQGSTRYASFIRRVVQSGFVRAEEVPATTRAGVTYATYLTRALPPLELEYSKARIQSEVRALDEESLTHLPTGVDGVGHAWVDLDGEGLSGVLVREDGAWRFKRNLGGGKLGAMQTLRTQPSLFARAAGGEQLLDLSGDGQIDVVSFGPPTPGFYERTEDGRWASFEAFRRLPNLRWGDPDLRFVDLTGDGHADVLVTEQDALTWYPSLAEAGFDEARRTPAATDEETGPRLVFADGAQSIYLADMTGDGLTDLVRIRNGEVCYWPNLGYGRFGAKVAMDNAPRFDRPDRFDRTRLRLADVDGSGANDLLYFGADGARIWFNQSGNAWSEPRRIDGFPRADDVSTIATTDLLGNGTVCLVWSSALPRDARSPVRYIDLMGGQKPHLLTRSVNNLGAETRITYAPSTKFYLEDQQSGRPWITRLPFPVHVVERVESYDHVSRNRFVTRYAYHHGFFDGREREFRGFGMVEQYDTEELATLSASATLPTGSNVDAASYVPVLTKTWFHTGVYLGRDRVSSYFAGLLDGEDVGEYFREAGASDAEARALLLEDTVLPGDLSLDEEREACRALRGSMLRQEIYALDGSDRASLPYAVTEHGYGVRCLQHRGTNPHAVFLVHDRESISYAYERTLVPLLAGQLADEATVASGAPVEWRLDPRVTQSLTLEIDDFGNVLKSASVGRGREHEDPSISSAAREQQTRTYVTYSEHRVTNAVDGRGTYRAPLSCEERGYELTGYAPSGAGGRFRAEDFVTRNVTRPGAYVAIFDEELGYSDVPTGGRQRRLIRHARTLFRRDDLVGPLALGRMEAMALPHEAYELALTPNLVRDVFNEGGVDRVDDALLRGAPGQPRAGYVHAVDEEGGLDPGWWTASGRLFFSPGPDDSPADELAFARRHFFMPRRARDAFHTPETSTERFVDYDGYDLLVEESRDALGNRVSVGERSIDPSQPLATNGQDYRVLAPALVMDANRNRTAVAFDALGTVVGTAVMGKPEDQPSIGDRLTPAFRRDLTPAEIDAFVAAPQGSASRAWLADATTRIVSDPSFHFRTARPDRPPSFAATLVRETHASDALPPQGLRVRVTFSYSDGFGREVQKKLQVEAGPVPVRDANGEIVLGSDNQPRMTAGAVSPRWVCSGWTVFDNKGQAVRQYEPYFTDESSFELGVRVGKSSVLFRDPLGRVVATLHPNHTWEKVLVGPWRQVAWDVSDTAAITRPEDDADVGDFFARLPPDLYSPTWSALRTDPAHATAFAARYPSAEDRDGERRAATLSLAHAATPTVAHADALGRTFSTVAHNRFQHADAAAPTEERYATRVVHDIESNPRVIVDAKGRIAARYDYDLLGRRIRQASMEAGQRWELDDVAGKPLCTWDDRGHRFRSTYDALQRPTDAFVQEGLGAEALVGRTVYGESKPAPERWNLRGKVVELFDQAGLVTTERYDFKGNVLRSARRLAETVEVAGVPQPAFKSRVSWSDPTTLAAESYVGETRFDATDRPIQLIAPRSDRAGTRINVVQPVYDAAGLLVRMDVWLDQPAVPTSLIDPTVSPPSPAGVAGIDHDAKGRRLRIEYRTVDPTRCLFTHYRYDPDTSRLVQLYTRRGVAFTTDCQNPAPPPDAIAAPDALDKIPAGSTCGIQNLHYTHDAAGNVTRVRDKAQQSVFFANARVDPESTYVYDAVSRLIEATGREHLGQVGGAPIPHSHDDVRRIGRAGIPHPNDGQALGRYTEQYFYDEAGNLTAMRHAGTDPHHAGWTRRYVLEEPSQLEAGKTSNRLTRTIVGESAPETSVYSVAGDGYDAHGNMLKMPHLHVLQWNERDQLQMTQRQAISQSDEDGVERQGERTWYVYDASGQRIRKVTERANGGIKDERIYLGGVEIYRKPSDDLERETLHVLDDQRRIALVETRTRGAEPGMPERQIRYQLDNDLGSVSLEVDEQSRVVSYEEYTPFGSTSYQAVRSRTEAPKRYRYTGMERDEESGFGYHAARYYAPWLARWVSSDPLGLVDGANSYQYARDNPRSNHDRTGTETDDETGPVIVGDPKRYGGQAAKAGYTKEHFTASAGINVILDEALGGRLSPEDLERLKGAVRRETETLLFRNDAAHEKTHARGDSPSTKGDNANTRAAKQPGYDRTGDFLALQKRVKELITKAGGSAGDVKKAIQSIRSGYAKGIKGEAVGNAFADAAEPLPKTVAPLLHEPAASSSAPAPKPKGSPGGTSTTGPKVGTVPSPKSTTGNFGASAAGAAGSLATSLVPGAAEAEAALGTAALYVAASPYSRFAAPLTTMAKAVPVAAAGGLVGTFAGNLAEDVAVRAGAGEVGAKTGGALAAFASGAAVGALLGAPTGIGAPIGAAVGGVAGLIGYGISKW